MVDKRVPDLTAIDGATLASADLMHVVDVSDTTDHASGTSKKLTYTELAAKILGGTAATATALATARSINGVSFNGTADITVTAAAGTLTGATLAAGVTASSLTSLGTLTALSVGGVSTFTSTSAAALAVGANGATNPVFAVDCSTASVVGGIVVKGGVTGGTTTITATDSGATHSLTIASKGSSTLNLNGGTTTQLHSGAVSVTATGCNVTPGTRSFTANTAFTVQMATGTSLTASTESKGVYFNLANTQTHATGALTTQRDFHIATSTHAFAGASTITSAYSMYIDGGPIAGTNATITNGYTIYSPGAAVGAGTTTSYGLWMAANSGATTNYAASFNGSGGEILRLRTDGQISILATNTAGGTTGAQTINKPAGKVNFAAAATTLVVTNSLCTTSSIVIATVLTDDTTSKIKNVVPGSGSFTITLDAAATAETAVGFLVIN